MIEDVIQLRAIGLGGPIRVGQVYEDRDVRQCYDTTEDGDYPVPHDYEGLLGIHRRRFKIGKVERGAHVQVENLHNRKQSRIQKDAFQTRTRQRGFDLVS